MPRPPSSEPTEVELRILRSLWDRGEASAREIHDALQSERKTNYSTTVKMLSVMRDKGLVACDSSVRPQKYRAAQPRSETQRSMLQRLVGHVFDGSTKSLVLQALSDDRPSEQDLAEIRRLLEAMEQEGSGGTER